MSDFLFRGSLADLDPEIYDLTQIEAERQVRKLIMIASESQAPLAVREALGSAFQNIYAEGYPDEETDAEYLKALYWGVYSPLIELFPLVSDPGTEFHYSNLTYSWLAILLERACGPDLREFSRQPRQKV